MIATPLFLDLPAVLDPVEIGHATGALSEEAVERVLPRLATHCRWYLWHRRADGIEDTHEHWDFAVYTRTSGRVLLNVKSSRRGAEEHEQRQRWGGVPYRVHPVIVRPDMDPAVVLGRVIAVCIVAVEQASAHRCVADHHKLCRLAGVDVL